MPEVMSSDGVEPAAKRRCLVAREPAAASSVEAELLAVAQGKLSTAPVISNDVAQHQPPASHCFTGLYHCAVLQHVSGTVCYTDYVCVAVFA